MSNKKIQNSKPVKKVKTGILNIVFSRTFIVVLLVLVQLIVFAVPFIYLQEYASYVYFGLLAHGYYLSCPCLFWVLLSMHL